MRPLNDLASSPPSDRSHETRAPVIRRPNRFGRTMRATVSTSGSSGIQTAYPAQKTCELRVFKPVKKTRRDELRNTRRVPPYKTKPEPKMPSKTLRRWLSFSLAIAIAMTPPAWGSAPAFKDSPASEQAETGWRTRSKDNICGLSNPRQVNRPAKVDYKKVLKATPEMKDLVRRNIKPRSAEGQILRQRAVDRVRRASSMVMQSHGHCSLWKRISHRDGRQIDDLTQDIIATLSVA